jgi:hypothetical protein
MMRFGTSGMGSSTGKKDKVRVEQLTLPDT